jgi:hypothetical protein
MMRLYNLQLYNLYTGSEYSMLYRFKRLVCVVKFGISQIVAYVILASRIFFFCEGYIFVGKYAIKRVFSSVL